MTGRGKKNFSESAKAQFISSPFWLITTLARGVWKIFVNWDYSARLNNYLIIEGPKTQLNEAGLIGWSRSSESALTTEQTS